MFSYATAKLLPLFVLLFIEVILRMKIFPCCSPGRTESFQGREIVNHSDNDHRRNRRAGGKTLASFARKRSFGTVSMKAKVDEMLQMGSRKISAEAFSFSELATATNGFHDDFLIGEGGFGRVYKGYIERINQYVAVKSLDRNGLQGNRKFLVEVLMFSRLHQHPKLVSLIGYCVEGDNRILVYENMSDGSLEDHLLDLIDADKPLDWNTRMKIAQGAAEGLEYLHDIAKPPVIYRDVKAANILLDDEFNPKLSDFGLAKLGPIGGKDHVSTRVMGTYGYWAPEYACSGQLTTKSDVYSFGVLLLEMITGRRVLDSTRPTEEQSLITWAEPMFRDRQKFTLMADPLLKGKYPEKDLYQALAVAAMSLQEEADTRPLMGDVVTTLDYLATPQIDYITTEKSYN